MKIAIIGTGAIGGFYGGLLVKGGHEVHFLLNSDYDYVRKNGLSIDSPDGSFELPKINCWKSSQDMPACDLIIICLKTTSNHLLAKILSPLLKNKPDVLTLQNGLGNEDIIQEYAKDCGIFGGLCRVAVNKITPGKIKHINYNSILMGEYNSSTISDKLKSISKAFSESSIDTQLSDDIIEARWRKLCWNIPFNGLTTIHQKETSEIMSSTDIRKHAIDIISEVIYAANALGKAIERSFSDKMIQLTDEMAPYKPSMFLDLLAGRPMEIEAIYKQPIETAKKIGIDMPLTQALYEKLSKLQSANKH